MAHKLSEGHVRSLDAATLRHVQRILAATFGKDIHISPIYPRDRGRPGYIVFFTMFSAKHRNGEPKVIQKPLSWEAVE